MPMSPEETRLGYLFEDWLDTSVDDDEKKKRVIEKMRVCITKNAIDDAMEKLLARGGTIGNIRASKIRAYDVVQRKLVSVFKPSKLITGYIGPQVVHLLAIKGVGSISDDASYTTLDLFDIYLDFKHVLLVCKAQVIRLSSCQCEQRVRKRAKSKAITREHGSIIPKDKD
uniref:Uncharacterized protein n=1 Tax=Lactuca sativa TaxID=4236 RepID=A0A9R1UGD2_LACSA|nr:hypothetical protein LSAT_V11C900481950 [Lactuca sativa]